MTTPRDHMAADMAWLFAQDGEEARDVVIDGVTHRAIAHELDAMAGPLDGSTARRLSVMLEQRAIATLPRPGYTMTVDGSQWQVEAVDPTGIVDVIIFTQFD